MVCDAGAVAGATAAATAGVGATLTLTLTTDPIPNLNPNPDLNPNPNLSPNPNQSWAPHGLGSALLVGCVERLVREAGTLTFALTLTLTLTSALTLTLALTLTRTLTQTLTRCGRVAHRARCPRTNAPRPSPAASTRCRYVRRSVGRLVSR